MACLGKRRWRWNPEIKGQFQDGRSHLTCPKCNASLGDAWVEKGKNCWRAMPNFDRQFRDGRRHLTCPRCSLLFGEAYWLPPTAWDWTRYIFSGNTGRAIAAIIFGVMAVLAFAVASAMALPSGDMPSWSSFCLLVLLISIFVFIVISPWAVDRWGHYPWWLYEE